MNFTVCEVSRRYDGSTDSAYRRYEVCFAARCGSQHCGKQSKMMQMRRLCVSACQKEAGRPGRALGGMGLVVAVNAPKIHPRLQRQTPHIQSRIATTRSTQWQRKTPRKPPQLHPRPRKNMHSNQHPQHQQPQQQQRYPPQPPPSPHPHPARHQPK